MSVERARFGFIIATKDRPSELLRLLFSLAGQSLLPMGVVIVDGGTPPIRPVLERPEFGELRIRYERCLPPSASRQRNLGLARIDPTVPWIGFLDDDVVMAPDALARMDAFLAAAEADLGGAAFNQIEASRPYAARLKGLPWVERLGLYGATPGDVMPSGFQVMTGRVDKTTPVRWLGTGASVWRREVFTAFSFDEWYGGYSYLEDLDFSYRVGKRYRLVLVAEADYEHLHAPHGRGGGFTFGRREARNRLHFVRKNPELSTARCCLTLGLRIAISLAMAAQTGRPYYLGRAFGALIGIIQSQPWTRREPGRDDGGEKRP